MSKAPLSRVSMVLGLAIAVLPVIATVSSESASAAMPRWGDASGKCSTPPSGTDLSNLSDSDLAYYCLPGRPSATSAAYPGWYHAMSVAISDRTNAASSSLPLISPPLFSSSPPPSAAGTAQPWAAIVGEAAPYSGIQGTWNVPSPYKTDAETRYSAQWVGVGGDCGSGCGGQLVQAGSEVDTYLGSVYYAAWYEVYPDQGQETRLTQFSPNPGDTMFVNISSSPSQSYIYIEDETTGAYVSVNPAATAAGCSCPSAEGVNENPNGGTGPMTFTNSVYFNSVAPANSGGNYYINNGPWTSFNASDSSGNILAAATAPYGSGSFRVDRYNRD